MQKQVTLNPGGSQKASFSVSPSAQGKYSVEIDGLKGSFTSKAQYVFCYRRFVHELIDKSKVVLEAFGKIGGLSASTTKGGSAGVEATIVFATSAERIVAEVLGWYEDGELVTGLTLYDYNKAQLMQRNITLKLDAPWEMVTYVVSGSPSAGIHTMIKRADGTSILDNRYACTLIKITRFQTELEYWRLAVPGPFSFNGKVTLDRGYGSKCGYMPLGSACNFYADNGDVNVPCLQFLSCDHYTDSGSWVMDGRIRET